MQGGHIAVEAGALGLQHMNVLLSNNNVELGAL